MEKDYKKVLEGQIKGLEGEVERQTGEYKEEKGKLGGKVLGYMYDKGLTEKVVKTGVISGLALILIGPYTALAAGGLYLGKRFVYDPLVKKKKK